MKRAAGIALALALLATQAIAQAVTLPFKMPDEYYLRIADLARESLSTVRLDNGRALPPESAADRVKPLVPSADERRIIDTGIVSGLALWCNLDWVPLFNQVAQAERATKKWSQRQMIYIEQLHSFSQGAIENSARQQGPCTASDKPRMAELLARTIKSYQAK